MNIKKELGEKIKRIRKKRGFTQEQLTEMIDISSRNLSNIEIGASFLKAETLEKLLIALNITTEELFANNHIKDEKELLADIYTYIDTLKNNPKKLEKAYKLLRCLTEDE